jgi:membrane-associated protease RseP (regulator of RpoE activity)
LSNDPPAGGPWPADESEFRAGPSVPPQYVYPPFPTPRKKFQNKLWKHILLLLLTLISTTVAGSAFYASYLTELGNRTVDIGLSVLLQGFWYGGAVLAILGAHEMGHYVACRHYDVDASLPYFIPFPALSGTLGAVIRIREPFVNRTVLFDIGVAGPIAGFVALVPILIWGLALSNVVPEPKGGVGWTFGEPLLFQFATRAIVGPVSDGQALNAHPLVFAAWLGMFATAFNLLPFGQLDGGHIIYAVARRLSAPASLLMVGVIAGLSIKAVSLRLIAVLMVVVLLVFGPRHPSVIHEDEPLLRGRLPLALFALLMLILCFVPNPVSFGPL